MGGAVALLLHKKDPTFWHGAVLVAPMCKVMLDRLYDLTLTTSLLVLNDENGNENII